MFSKNLKRRFFAHLIKVFFTNSGGLEIHFFFQLYVKFYMALIDNFSY